ncbi:flagellar motor stator protein MotA [Kozakia baliensis]|uniref:Flagellar motor stator protein MotA n=1 Tax=Kozakia baliensis TaxID=153496 RepID=A0A1D8UTX8_9PROT|nr:flagellar motor stator protein MotA [Kozakia baliensis]AOX17110.1 flagellar motor stator protein MotA [Kozakia baliensis]GBR24800.1 flagellar motor protein MotA [Kozakia baliensis NRIC 0488]GEL63814.1 flagellar motor protein MotA [Kozakia baliensis]
MFLFIGFGVVLACVFGSFIASGGAIGPLLASMPFELITILGAAIGSFVMANSLVDLKHIPAGIKQVLKGPRFARADYIDLLNLLFQLLKSMHAKGYMAIESHVEEPENSTIFTSFPKIKSDEQTRDLVCDYLRLIGMNVDDPVQFEEAISRELKKNIQEEMHLPHALQTLSDALPALGIVAAVLGVIKTMASISKPPVILGEMIAGALVGTFLGVLLAYGVVAPIAARLGGIVGEDACYHRIIRSVLVAHLQGSAPQISIEIGRKDIPSHCMPRFQELEKAMTSSTATA